MKLFSRLNLFFLTAGLCWLSPLAQAGREECRSAIGSSAESQKREPVPSRAYTHLSLISEWRLQGASAQKIALQNDKIFFIDEGWLFSQDRHNGSARYHNIFGLKVLSVIAHNQSLAVLQEGGLVSVFDKPKNQWIKIDDSVEKILSTGAHLFALAQNALWIYGSDPDSHKGSSFSLRLQEGFSVKKIKLEENIQDIERAEDGFNVIAVFNNGREPALINIQG